MVPPENGQMRSLLAGLVAGVIAKIGQDRATEGAALAVGFLKSVEAVPYDDGLSVADREHLARH
jgi:hypothetical protein